MTDARRLILAVTTTVVLFGCQALDQQPSAGSTPRHTASAQTLGKGHPPTVEDFPAALAQFDFAGAISTTTTTGRPFSCGAGAGPDGIVLFEYAVYLEVDGVTRALVLDVKPFTGSASIARAGIDTVQPDRRLTNDYLGSLQVTITGGPRSYSGTVSGSLQAVNGTSSVQVDGTWSCSSGPLLGPG